MRHFVHRSLEQEKRKLLVLIGIGNQFRRDDAAGLEVARRLRQAQPLGVTVLEQLRGLDHVAYLRFASVYKGFEDLADFEREVVELQKTTEPKRRRSN